jgi:hypothetical protein
MPNSAKMYSLPRKGSFKPLSLGVIVTFEGLGFENTDPRIGFAACERWGSLRPEALAPLRLELRLRLPPPSPLGLP